MVNLSHLKQHFILARLHRPVGIWLLMWPSFWVFGLCGGHVKDYLLFFLGAVCLRSLGCIYNDIVDMDLDKKVERTRSRPLAAGSLTRQEGLKSMLFWACGGMLIWLQLKSTTQWVSLIGLAFLFIYPWAKRVTYFPQVVLGMAFSWGIIMAACEINVELLYSPFIWLLYGASIAFTTAYDTIYAFQDIQDDIKANNYSLAIHFQKKPKLMISLIILLFLGFIGFSLANAPHVSILGVVIVPLTMALLLAALIRRWQPNNILSSAFIFYAHHWLGMILWILLFFIRVIPLHMSIRA